MMKSVFVSLYMMVAVTIAANAAQLLWATRDYLSWGGVLLVTAPFVILIGWMMMMQNVATARELTRRAETVNRPVATSGS